MNMRKLPASAGAEWLLGAFRLLLKSPLGFGLLAMVYAAISLIAGTAMAALPDMAYLIQAIMFVIGPLLIAGMIYAAHEVDAGRGATPAHLFASMQNGKAGRVLTTLIPQAAVLVVIMLLLYALVGQDNLEALMDAWTKIQAQAQAGKQVDPQLVMQMPLGRLAIWVILALIIALISLPFTFTVIPDMLFNDVSLWPAMKRSAASCLRNLPALLVCLAMGFVVLMAVSIGLGMILAVLQAFLGQKAALIGNVVLQSVFVCFFAGTMYFAWKDLLGSESSAPAEVSGVAM